jgi:REP element-mobilizing transposase RayT
MPSFIKIWIHLIWTVKNRNKIIHPELKPILYDHIKTNAKDKNIYIDHINGTVDHIHLLLSLRGDQSISKIAFLLKGESSHWINANKLTKMKFEWQNEFMALSVSESLLPKVREYIRNQEIHHKKISFKEEYDVFLKKYGLDRLRAKAQ